MTLMVVVEEEEKFQFHAKFHQNLDQLTDFLYLPLRSNSMKILKK